LVKELRNTSRKSTYIRRQLDCGVLAYQVANKLDLISKSKGSKVNWWGAANNLQIKTCEPNILCFETLTSHINLENLNNQDRDLLEQILSD